MKQFFTLLLLCCGVGLFAQVNYTANDQIDPYTGIFRPGVNPAYYPNWSSEQVADIAAGNALYGVPGVGVKTFRTAMSDAFVTEFGYDYLLSTYDYYGDIGLTDLTTIVGFPAPSHQETTEYCSGIQSEMFAGLYEPIWDGGANGTPYNDNNYFAAYMYEIVTRYTDHIKFWEIWNEPGFDYSGQCGWREPGDPVCNWWDQNPDPCDNKLRAPIESYVRTLRIAYDVIKTISPDDYVVVAGVGFESFLDAILRNTDNPNGGSTSTADYPLKGGAYFDIMGFHSYPHFDGTTIYWDQSIGALAYERHSDRAAYGIPFKQNIRQDVLDNYGYDGITYPKKQSIVTEINIPRDPVGGNWIGSEEAQKNYIIKAFFNAMKYDVHQIHVFRLGEREYFGTANNGQTGNPEFNLMGLYQRLDDILPYEQIINIEGIAYKTTSDCLFGSTYDAAQTALMNLPSDIDGGAFLKANGEYTYVIWAKTTIDLSEFASANYSFPASFGFTDVYKKEWNFSQTLSSNQISANNITLDATPIFLTENEYIPPPIITLLCPDDLTVIADQTSNGATVNYNQPNVSTTCSTGLNVSLTNGLVSGGYFPVGTTVVEFEATDDCGNVVICSFNVTVQVPQGGCPDEITGFTFMGEYNDHKYFVSQEIGRPKDAQVNAQTFGGHLAVINDAGENDFIQANIGDLVYIGLNDEATEGQMEWVNNDPVGYTNYDLCAFCNPNTEDDDFVVMHPWNGGWSFSNQFNQRLYVIELPCDGDGGGGTNLSINCPASQNLTAASQGGTVTATWNTPTTSGNCTVDIVNITQTGGPNSGDNLAAGTYTISYMATDGCGNSASCSFTITVADGSGGGTDCPEEIAGFTVIGEFNGHKYYLSNDISRPVDAQVAAQANDGYLVVINDQAENDFIQQNISEMTYIGLNDFDTEGTLTWVNGDPLSYNNVNVCGFCNENSDDMDFVIMAPWNGDWSFSNFYNNRPFVMEIDCDAGGSGGFTVNCDLGIPSGLITPTDPSGTTVLWNAPTATTDCSGGVTITQTAGPASGSFFDAGTSTYIEYTVTDDCGNSEICSGTVAVQFLTGGLVCPDDITVTATSADGAVVTFNNPTLLPTGCDPGPFQVIAGLPSGSTFPVGTTTVQFLSFFGGSNTYCQNGEVCSFTVTVEPQSGGCPNDLPNHTFLGEFGGSAYFLSDEPARAEDGEAVAQGFGGHLATINSQAENDFLWPLVSGVVYIGLNDAEIEGTLQWYSGATVNYTNFNICGFCNENSDDQDYAIMHGWNGGWSWSNFWNQRQYIIEVPCLGNPNGDVSSLIVFNNNILTSAKNKRPKLESVIPNPAEDFIFVKIKSETEENVDLQIFDARGSLVKTIPTTLYKGLVFKELDIADLPSGLYFVKIPTGQKKHSDLKFIKQRF